MPHPTIRTTTDAGLCTSCGMCKGICPKNCITWERSHGMYLPKINDSLCVHCGLCVSVCPGLGHNYPGSDSALSAVTGSVLESYNAWSHDATLRHDGASGGVVSTVVRELLSKGLYESVFCLDSYNYGSQLRTARYTAEAFPSSTQKSRYLPVSHENAILYMKAHPTERIILIATSCCLRGLTSVIQKQKLDRDNYLLIGLFCDKVFQYNFISYLADRYCTGAPLSAMHFKNKESGGWPGDMKLFPENGDSFFIPITERARLKEYFMPERCLYCVDKLNVSADISLGDNYTGQDSSSLGSNSVLIRTQRGLSAWQATCHTLEFRPIDIPSVQKAQYLENRLDNLCYGDLKSPTSNLNTGVPRTQTPDIFRQAWNIRLKRLRSGAVYDHSPNLLHKQLRADEKKPNLIRRFLRRFRGYISRIIHR